MTAAVINIFTGFSTTSTLEEVQKQRDIRRKEAAQYNQTTTMKMLNGHDYTVRALMGHTCPSETPSIVDEGRLHTLLYDHRFVSDFILGKIGDAMILCDSIRHVIHPVSIGECEFYLFDGLINIVWYKDNVVATKGKTTQRTITTTSSSSSSSSVAVWSATKGTKRINRLRIIKACMKQLKKYAKATPLFALGKMHLLKAELLSLSPRKEAAAREHFMIAVALAKDNGYYIDHVVSLERYTRFLESIGDTTNALSYLEKTCEAYRQWNAYAKVDMLEAELREKRRDGEVKGKSEGKRQLGSSEMTMLASLT